MRRFPVSWSDTLSKLGFQRKRQVRQSCRDRYRRRPRLEGLEPRQLLSITVNTVVDENDGIGVGGVSLRDAITAAAVDETIDFDPSLSGGTITLDHNYGQLVIDTDMTILGPGAQALTIRADGSHGVFKINSGVEARISGLTISGGGGVSSGGGVCVLLGS